jgi:hypothetical protein
MQVVQDVNQDGQPRWTFIVDEPEGKGTIVIEPSGYGLWVTFPEVNKEPVLLLDLFYQSAAGADLDRPPVPGVAIHSPQTCQDMVAYARFLPAPQGTRIEFETGVEEIATAAGRVWGYPTG